MVLQQDMKVAVILFPHTAVDLLVQYTFKPGLLIRYEAVKI